MRRKPYQEGDEPVPGYRLYEYLGQGGFGEVWNAVGPGGVHLALKMIHNLERKKGGRELRALRLLKNIRHPHLVPLTAFWLKTADGDVLSDESHDEIPSADRQASPSSDPLSATMSADRAVAALTESTSGEAEELVIAMGLAQMSLFDRLTECSQAGLTGIAFDELLTYLDDSSRAIDLLNITHGIQHCDIKPQNILIQSGAAQVADFGLATSIGDMRESSMAAGTIAYGAPEVLLGSGPGPWTDQYSLAITYYELRTGTLPFKSERISDVFAAKQHGTIELSGLPPGEREVIAKAASIRPEDRYANTAEMVRALRQCDPGGSATDRSAAQHSTDAYIPRPVGDTATLASPPQSWNPDGTARRRPFARRLGGLAVLVTVLVALTLALRLPGELGGGKWRFAQGPPKPVSSTTDGVTNRQPAVPTTSREPARVKTAELPEPGRRVGANRTLDAAAIAETARESAQNTKKIVAATEASAQNTKKIVEATEASAQNTKKIVAATEASAKNTKKIVEAAERMSLSLEAIREGFAAAQRGGIIEDPQTPGEVYHNARLYELRGDYPKARDCYVRFFSYGLELVDPHRRYQRLLVIQEGKASAREVYSAMEQTAESSVVRFAAILLDADDRRLGRLTEFTQLHPTFAPAVWELSREYSKTRLGVQSLADMAREKKLLEEFRQLTDQGHLLRYFLDQSVAAEMIDDATARLAALQQFDETVFEHPITVTATMSNSAWTVNLAIAEVAREILVQTEDGGPYESTGHTTYVDQRTGSPNAKPYFQLPLHTPASLFSVEYKDIRGQLRGPFAIDFDPERERIRWGKSVLDGFPNSWIVYGRFNGNTIAYFTHLVGYRYAIREIRYGIDTVEVDTLFPLSPPDPLRPSTIAPGEKIYITIPDSTQFLAVKLTYADGTRSDLVRFERPGAAK